MATDKKPLPETDDDIIDLTDLVEEGPADAKAAAEDGPVDMSFEKELDDLFGDAAPAPAAPADTTAPPAAPAGDDDLIDLTDLGLDEETPVPAKPAAQPDAEAEDVIDLAGLGLDDETPPPAAPAPTPAPAANPEDELIDLAGLGLDDEAALPTAAPEQPPAEADLDLSSLGLDETPPETPAAAPAPDASGPEAVAAVPQAEPAPATPEEAPAAATSPELAAPPDEDATDLADLDLDALAPSPETLPAADEGAAVADLLGDLPEAPEATQTNLSSLDALEATEPTAEPAATAASATAEPTVQVGAIDLGALDDLIDAAKGPKPVPEPEEPTAQNRLEALAGRLESLETTTAALLDKFEALSQTDGDALAEALSARLEDALSERVEAVLSGLPPAPDLDGFKTEIMAELDTRAVKDRTRLLADLAQTLDKRFDTLAEGLPKAEAFASAAAVEELRQAVGRLEAQAGEREAAFKDFASGMETRLAELRRELPQPGEFATQTGLTDGLEALRETLARDIAGSLDERLSELRRELRETLAGDITASLDERLAGLTEDARKVAREEAQALGEVLSGRIEALETDRIDPEGLADKIRSALRADLPDAAAFEQLLAKPDRKDLDALREELVASVEKTVPRVAASVIREEIAALVKDFS